MNKLLSILIKKKKVLIYLLFISILIVIDQFTKNHYYNMFSQIISKTNNPYISKKIFPFLNFVLVFNKGIAFGIFNSDIFSNFMPITLIIVATILVLFLLYKLWYETSVMNSIVFSLIISGGSGNLIDRIRISAVIDFIDFHIKNYHWPAFNLADSYVCIGVCLYILFDWYNKKSSNNKHLTKNN